MKKIVLTPKAKKISMITGIAVVVCAGVLSFVLLQRADAKSEKSSTVSSTASSAVSPSFRSASSETSGTSTGVAPDLSSLQNTAVSSASKRSNCSTVCSSTSGTVTNPKTTDAPSPKTKTNDSPKTKTYDSPNTKAGTNDSPKSAAQDKPSEKTGNTTPVKPSAGTVTPAPKTPAAPTVTPFNISADKQAIIAYGESKGLTYNPNLRPEHSSWRGRDDLLIDDSSDADIIEGCKSDIDGMIRMGYKDADFNPYFEKKSDKTNDYYSYVLYQ